MFLVVAGGVIALVEALVCDVREANWGAAIFTIGAFLLIVSVGLALVERGVLDAREAGNKIIPPCPYAKAQIQKHTEW